MSTDDQIASHIIDIEQKALALQRNGQLKEAAKLFAMIIEEQPDWEHGTAFYNLACCYEDLGELSSAEKYYRDALRYDSKNPYFLGGLASFLYIHGENDKAFAAYLKLLEIERANGDQRGIETTTTAVRSLGKKMGLSEEALLSRISTTKKD